MASTGVKHYRVVRNGKMGSETISGKFKTIAEARQWYIDRTIKAAETIGLNEADIYPLLDFQLIETSGRWPPRQGSNPQPKD